jgi:hypothetical protein
MFELPSDREILDAIDENNISILAGLCMPLAKTHDNWRFSQDICIKLSVHNDPSIRRDAILSLSLITLFHHKIEKNIIKPVLLNGLEDKDQKVREAAQTALNDINHWMNWHIGNAQKNKRKIKPIKEQNNINKPRIKFSFEGSLLQALISISFEFENCGKVGDILYSTSGSKKSFKLNDNDFICVYKGLLRAIESHRYPNKSGKEYNSVKELIKIFEQLHLEQRYTEIRL